MREGRKYPKPQKSVHQLVRRLPIRGSFLGQIVTVGPAGEADFTNGFYWVIRQIIDPKKTTRATMFKDDTRYKAVKVLNLSEVGLGTDELGVHILLNVPPHLDKPWTGTFTHRYVNVWAANGIWVTDSYPGLIASDYGVGVVCQTEDGCVDMDATGAGWFKAIAAGYIGAGEPPECEEAGEPPESED